MERWQLKCILTAVLMGTGTRGDDDLQFAGEMAERIIQKEAPLT